MIKFEHTVFALPFAMLGAVFGSNGWPSSKQIFWIIVAILMHQVSMISIIMGIPCQTRSSRDGGVQMSNLLSALGTEDGPQGRP